MNPPVLESSVAPLSPSASLSSAVALDRAASGFRGLPDLRVAEEMIASLHTLTSAGSRYMMSKILSVFRGHIDRRSVGPQNNRTLKDLVTRLEEQAEPSWPDVLGFSARARQMMDLLLAVS